MQNIFDTYPIDSYGVKSYGLAKWLDHYQAPVRSEVFQEFYDAILDSFVAALPEERNEVYWTALCDYKLLISLAHLFFFHARLNRLRDAGCEFVLGRVKTHVEEAFLLHQNHLFNDCDFNVPLIDVLRFHWRKVRLNYGRVNLFHALFPGLGFHDHFLLGDLNAKETKGYCESSGIKPITLQPMLFTNPSGGETGRPRKAIDLFVDQFLANVEHAIPSYGDVVDNVIEKRIRNIFFNTYIALHNCRRSIRNWTPGTLLVTGFGNLFHRIFCCAWNSIGGESVGFSHGNPFALAYKPGNIRSGSHTILKRYVVNSTGEAELVGQAVNDFSNGIGPFPKVVKNPVNVYRTIYDRHKNNPRPKKVEKVMIVGFPMSYHLHAFHSEQYVLPHIHLESTIQKILKREGYHVIYKAHPDTIKETRGLYESLADEIITDNFETCVGRADCVVFPSPATTTFGFSLLTGIPMVLINTEGSYWGRNVFDLLSECCGIVPSYVDARGRIVFVPEALLEEVARAVEKTNHKLVEEYALR